MANYKKFKQPVEVKIRVEKETKERLELEAVKKGISLNEWFNRLVNRELG